LTVSEQDRSRELLAEAWRDLEAGRPGDAALSFERLLLHDPRLAEARDGLEQARAAQSEVDRLRALAGDSGRIARVRGAFAAFAFTPRPTDAEDQDAPSMPPARSSRWSRPLLVAAWVAFFAVLGLGLVASWGRLLQTLTRRPAPATQEARAAGAESRAADAARPGGDR
jgi:hypothetical protein